MHSTFIALVVALCTISVTFAHERVHHTRHCASVGAFCPFHDDWTRGPRADPDRRLRLVLAVAQAPTSLLEAELMTVSNPDSSRYGDHLTLNEVTKLAARPESATAVAKFLADNKIPFEASRGTDFFVLIPTVEQVEKVLETKFHEYHTEDGRNVVRCEEFSLPKSVSSHIDFISHTTRLPPRIPRRIRSYVPFKETEDRSFFSSSPLNDAIERRSPVYFVNTTTPDLINMVYNVTSNRVQHGSSQSVFEYLGQSFSPSDLRSFQSKMNLVGEKMDNIIGPNNATDCVMKPENCNEGNLDVQYIMAVAQHANNTYWSMSDSEEPFLDWVVDVANATSIPLVHSISYGAYEVGVTPKILARFDAEIVKLGLRGVTVVVSSGDDGVANFAARGDQTMCGFYPVFPASSPHVTTLGATMGPEIVWGGGEIACTSDTGGSITTGGGFSKNFPRPRWQDSAVAPYLNNPLTPASELFNTSGRAYPDIALLGHNYAVAFDFVKPQGLIQVSGTSASAPVFAAMVTLINDARKAAGRSAVGFLNPALYKLWKGDTDNMLFNDITKGVNNCAAAQEDEDGKTDITCCETGFSATKGYDAVSGLGSINFGMLKDALVLIGQEPQPWEDSSAAIMTAILLLVLGMLWVIFRKCNWGCRSGGMERAEESREHPFEDGYEHLAE